MKHVPEASDIPSFTEAVGADAGEVRHQLDVVAQASGFTEEEAKDLDAFVAEEGWGGDAEGVGQEEEGCSGQETSDCEEEAKSDDYQAEEEEEEEGDPRDEESETKKDRVRRVKAPESVTKRAHDAVQRQRKAAGAEGGGKSSRNHQKRKVKGKILYKHRDF